MHILGSVLNSWKKPTGPRWRCLWDSLVCPTMGPRPRTLVQSLAICSVRLDLPDTASGPTQPSEHTSAHHWPQQLRKRKNDSNWGICHSWRKGSVGAGQPPYGTTHPWAGGCPAPQTLRETGGVKAYLRRERGKVWLWGLVWKPREEFMTLSPRPKLPTWFLSLETGFSINKGIF